ncbi:MAG TPA: Rieske 2Fe-2S domain-containing protein [Phycisphaerae bacterium]|nr:Rieske 2Fe-2S domain-containing protein [Phycisphaerae bacterium]HOJ75841.1 Rieske 2Fe-2S domain-containing protein [Phycisphaerae bacterium]HOM53227.1 Rieske 2Fe-2S domain-containing protein [Phycisphaerae bacterium]HON68096.1 Rieske 2Fe-2S domain-containing protein [Phycisphaerae bacterium]HOQ86023.1 Rieske 2Fe-2S domain-containing protein [Phycisphaerae bacterium]
MQNYQRLIAAADVPAGKAVRVQVDGRCFVVCNDAGKFYVTDCTCPHAGGPLGGADVRDGNIICPVHYWPWNLETGLTDESMPALRLRTYPCDLRDGHVFADISAASPRPGQDLDCHSQ